MGKEFLRQRKCSKIDYIDGFITMDILKTTESKTALNR